MHVLPIKSRSKFKIMFMQGFNEVIKIMIYEDFQASRRLQSPTPKNPVIRDAFIPIPVLLIDAAMQISSRMKQY